MECREKSDRMEGEVDWTRPKGPVAFTVSMFRARRGERTALSPLEIHAMSNRREEEHKGVMYDCPTDLGIPHDSPKKRPFSRPGVLSRGDSGMVQGICNRILDEPQDSAGLCSPWSNAFELFPCGR